MVPFMDKKQFSMEEKVSTQEKPFEAFASNDEGMLIQELASEMTSLQQTTTPRAKVVVKWPERASIHD